MTNKIIQYTVLKVSGFTYTRMAWWLSWLERRPVTAEVEGSNPSQVGQVSQSGALQSLLRGERRRSGADLASVCFSRQTRGSGAYVYEPAWRNWQTRRT